MLKNDSKLRNRSRKNSYIFTFINFPELLMRFYNLAWFFFVVSLNFFRLHYVLLKKKKVFEIAWDVKKHFRTPSKLLWSCIYKKYCQLQNMWSWNAREWSFLTDSTFAQKYIVWIPFTLYSLLNTFAVTVTVIMTDLKI